MKCVLPLLLLAASTLVNTAAADDTWAERLGYPAGKRVLILHANRVGIAYEANRPSEELLAEGFLQSVAAMPPCPWFDEFAKWYRNHPGHDVGVNLTFNSHLDVYRWGPVSSRVGSNFSQSYTSTLSSVDTLPVFRISFLKIQRVSLLRVMPWRFFLLMKSPFKYICRRPLNWK